MSGPERMPRCCGVVSSLLWRGLLTTPPRRPKVSRLAKRETFGRRRGPVRRPGHNRGERMPLRGIRSLIGCPGSHPHKPEAQARGTVTSTLACASGLCPDEPPPAGEENDGSHHFLAIPLVRRAVHPSTRGTAFPRAGSGAAG